MEIKKYKDLDELIQGCPVSENIGDNLIRAWAKINNSQYDRIVCAISGGLIVI